MTGTENMRRVATASFLGSAIEWYDFFLFGTAAALVFNTLFFPGSDPLSGTLLAFATFGVGFLARPLGGIVAGHLGDRIGRKKTLVATLLLMGGATALIGLLPTAESIGVWAPVLLVVLRLAQGLGVGGEWGGAALITVEHSPAHRRGFYGSFPQLGVPAGLLLATAAFALVSTLPEDQLLSWGWRVPFLASIALVAVGLFIRMRISEPPVFEQAREAGPVTLPVLTVLREFPRQVLLSAGIRFADNVLYYVCATFALTYVATELGLPRSLALTGVLIASAVELVTMPLFGALSDRIGRRPVVAGGAVLTVLAALPFFWLLDTGSPAAIVLAMVVTISVAHAATFAPLAAWFAEMFGTGVRYSGVSVGFQLGSLLSGAPTPLLATALLAWSGGAPWPVAAMIGVAGLVTLVCAVLAGETFRGGIAAPAPGPAARAADAG
ncbi:MFS transporter [Pseudonocardia spirodelae]|uniref:MFS transporter n=1 Tax=Pseudonocardia spirodelae TaxID=3133431 RepID=A0ABU8T2D1_9PSEU